MCKQNLIYRWLRPVWGYERAAALISVNAHFSVKESVWVSVFASKQNHRTLNQMRVACVCVYRNRPPKKGDSISHLVCCCHVKYMIFRCVSLFDEKKRERFLHHVTDWRQLKFNENLCHFDFSINVHKLLYTHTYMCSRTQCRRKLVASNQHKCQPMLFFSSLPLSSAMDEVESKRFTSNEYMQKRRDTFEIDTDTLTMSLALRCTRIHPFPRPVSDAIIISTIWRHWQFNIIWLWNMICMRRPVIMHIMFQAFFLSFSSSWAARHIPFKRVTRVHRFRFRCSAELMPSDSLRVDNFIRYVRFFSFAFLSVPFSFCRG